MTSAMVTTCVKPGCTGQYLDGYCDVCGSPAPGPAASVAASGGTPGGTATLPGGCTKPGCSGTFVDGYCDVCGTPAPAMAAGATPSTTGAPPGETAEVSTRTSSRLASAAIGTARTGGTKATRRVGTSSTRLRAARLGAGLTTVAPAPPVEPATAILTDPQVSEAKRFCPSCGAAVGRSVGNRPGRTEGFCPQCRNPYSFAPKLRAGDLVGGQYEVAGALAHGGLGWIYLARDKNVSDRWVVLKGLLNAGDADALAAAIAERQFLAQVEHPRIVEIYNFVTHDGAGYTVMEYVGGHSLKDLLKERMAQAGRYDPFPLDVAIAYVLEVLPAFEYLHDLGLVYCDFKPDNLIQIGDDVKLIDLGGVRRLDDEHSAIYGTVGYQAPEVSEVGVSVASDIYTLGRAFLVLAMEFRGYQSTYVDRLPPVDETPLFGRYDSFYRFIAKACAPDPADRFASVAEMRVQLLGVLREVVAAERGEPAARTAAPSLLFGSPPLPDEFTSWRALPALRPDPTDSATAWLAAVDVPDPSARIDQLQAAPDRTAAVLLELARAGLEADSLDLVAAVTEELLAADPWDWRAIWMQGLAALAADNPRGAQGAFNAVYGQVAGELAPKLALAVACAGTGDVAVAEGLFLTCARTDAAYVPVCAFALAALHSGSEQWQHAVAALDLVPMTSRAYPEARLRRAWELIAREDDLRSIVAALDDVAAVGLDPATVAEVTRHGLTSALELVRANGPLPGARVAGWPVTEDGLRDGLEATLRQLAAATDDAELRVQLVDEANLVRRWTRW